MMTTAVHRQVQWWKEQNYNSKSPHMAIQFIALKPLSSLIPIQCKNSISLCRGTQLSVKAAEYVPWEVQIPPNAIRRKHDPSWRGGFSLGVDLGLSWTGVAISKGFTVRPLTVVKLRGQKLELWLLDLAKKKVCLMISFIFWGWRVYLQDEHGTSCEAWDHMLAQGVSKSVREGRVDAYAAMKVLERYFALSGKGIELVVPKQIQLQNNLRRGPPKDADFF